MTTFSGRNASSATLRSPIDAVWAVLVDPELLARLTPQVERIEANGDRWRWTMSSIPVLSMSIAPSFTEIMRFEEPTRIEYHHDPACAHERAAAEGVYTLAPSADGGTHVSIDITITVDLPIPRIMRSAVETTMNVVIAGIGRGFSERLLRHLGER